MAVRITHFIRGLVLGVLHLLLTMKPLVPSVAATAVAACCAFAPAASFAAEVPRQSYDIPRGDAAETLKRFADASGRQVVYLVDTVRGVVTNPVKGNFTAREVLGHLLRNTALVVVEDEKTGALLIQCSPTQNPASAAGSDFASDRNRNTPGNKPMKNSLSARITTALAAALATVLPAQTPAGPSGGPTENAKADSVVQLSVFEVSTDKDIGYQSVSSLSGTRTGELLRDLPVSVSILNQEFLRDIAVTDTMQAIGLYGIGSEPLGVPGIGIAGSGGGGNSLSFRGIQSSWQGRDGFIWYGVSDNFAIETLEVNRGPSGNVFGDSRAGGLPNIVSKRAKLRDFGELGLRWDSEGSSRYTIDWNRRVTPKAAVRLNLMKQDQRDWRDTNYDKRQGAQIGLQYDFTRNTRLSVIGEYNNVGRVASTGVSTDNFREYTLGSGTNAPGTIAGTGTIQGAGNTQRWTYVGGKPYNLISSATTLFRQTTVAAANTYAVGENVLARHMQLNGPSDRLDHDTRSLTAVLEHRVGPNTVLQGAYNLTLSDRFDFQANRDGIRRDVNPNLPGPGGTLTANPNFDQLYVDHRWTQSQYYNRTAAYRITAVQDLDFGFTKQRLIVNGSARDDRFRLAQRQELLTPQVIAAAGLTGAAALQTNNAVRRRFYLRDGNDGVLRHTDAADFGFNDVTGGQKTRAFFYSGSALLMGRYWENRILSTVGVRRDDYESRQVRVLADPATNLARFETGGSGEQIWREQIGVFGTSWNYGLVFSPQSQWRVFANYAENFQQNGTVPYFNGDVRQPRVGDGYDYGFSVYLWKDRLTATVTRFDNKANNENLTGINNQNTADEINRLLGTNYSTAFAADTQSRRATGTEVEIIANATRHWTLSFKYSMRKNVNTDFAPRLTATLAAMKAKTADSTQWVLTQTQLSNLFNENPSARAAWNYATRYSFTSGPLKGARMGAYGFFRQGQTVFTAGRPNLDFKSYVMVNAFAGYEWRVTQKFRNDLQLNVENLTNQQLRIGSGYTGYSYLAPTKFILQNTLRF